MVYRYLVNVPESSGVVSLQVVMGSGPFVVFQLLLMLLLLLLRLLLLLFPLFQLLLTLLLADVSAAAVCFLCYHIISHSFWYFSKF